jgi:hypothetical protein
MIRKTANAKSTHLIQCSFARCPINDRVNSSSAFTKSEGNVKNKLAPISLFLSGTGKHHLTIHWSLFKHKCFSLITLHFFQDFNSGYKRNDRGHNNKTRIHPIRLDVVIVFNKKKKITIANSFFFPFARTARLVYIRQNFENLLIV